MLGQMMALASAFVMALMTKRVLLLADNGFFFQIFVNEYYLASPIGLLFKRLLSLPIIISCFKARSSTFTYATLLAATAILHGF